MKQASEIKKTYDEYKANQLWAFEEKNQEMFDSIQKQLEDAANHGHRWIRFDVVFSDRNDIDLFEKVLKKYGYSITTEVLKELTYKTIISF